MTTLRSGRSLHRRHQRDYWLIEESTPLAIVWMERCSRCLALSRGEKG